MKRIIVAIAAAAFIFAPAQAQQANVREAHLDTTQGSYTPSFKKDGSKKAPKNVILMIGDGMGMGALCAGMYINGGELTITNLQGCGFVRTQSASDFTTDSAASGTAYACGQKTHNGALGMDVNDNPIPNIPEKVAAKGIVSGVISTDPVNGATPAAFFAHQPRRGMTDEIWADLPASKLSFIAAGDTQAFNERPEATRKAISETFAVVDNLADAPAGADRIAYIPDNAEVKQSDENFQRGNFLAESTEYAVNYLSNKSKKGFFLMVEGAHIDHGGHANNLEVAVREVLDFDKAVEAAIRFAEKDGNTLVVISADHETGGLALDWFASSGYGKGIYTSYGHTPVMVPLFVYGPSSKKFICVQENSDVSNKIVDLLLK